jgi:outer membrane biosynthesis protein TonB
VLNGKALYLPKPFYPPNARSARASGVVMVEVTLSEEGARGGGQPVSQTGCGGCCPAG